MTIQDEVRDELLARFLRYISIDTQSDPESQSYPSTDKQLDLSRLLLEELHELGISSAKIDDYGYLTAHIEATAGYEAATPIGFLAHVDTSPDMTGAGVSPQVIKHYDGMPIRLGNSSYTLSLEDFPELSNLVGHTLIMTDGTTLLGADNKAGVAEIMTLVAYLIRHQDVPHGKICIAFTPDEEIGRGVDYFDVEQFGARFAYTVDGGEEGELEYENFNASAASIVIEGRNVHPGYAKDKMINALQLATDLHRLLPEEMRPERTSQYEGFFHLTNLSGSVDRAEMHYIIRDHSDEKFAQKEEILRQAVAQIQAQNPRATLHLSIKEQYRNMRQQVEPHPELIDLAKEAMQRVGVRPLVKPIRGGTDGARLSFMGLPCPNIFTGGMNFHGRYEYASLTTMCRAVATLVHLTTLWSSR